MNRAALVMLAVAVTGCGAHVVWSGRSADRSRALAIVADDGRHWIEVDGRRRAAYDAVAAWSIASAGARFVFAARRPDGWVVVDGGHPGPPWRGIGEIVVAGDRTAYSAQGAGGWHVVVDGQVGPAWDTVWARTLRFAADPRHHAYAAARGGRSHVVVDGVVGPGWDGVGQLALSPDARHVAYAARQGRAASVILDGVAGPTHRAIAHLTLVGDRAVYAARDDDGWRVVDATTSEPYLAVRAIVTNGVHAAWLARGADHDAIGCDGRVVAAAPAVVADSLTLGAGCDVAWVERDGDRVVVARGTTRRTVDAVGPLRFSADGRSFGYAFVDRGRAWVSIDGVDHARDRDGDTWTSGPVFAPTGARVAYLSRRGTDVAVMVDDRPTPIELVIDDTFAFSRDGRHWAVLAGSLAREELFFVVDGTRRVPLPTRELFSAAAQTTLGDPFLTDHGDVLTRWAAAEAERAAAP